MLTVQISSSEITNDIDVTAPFYEVQSFESIFAALRWQYVRTRLPICWQKLLHSRYLLANMIYMVYSIGILLINFHPIFNETVDNDRSANISNILDQSIHHSPLVSRSYIGLGLLHLLSAILYWWAWRDRSWLDMVMIPEYLNHIAAGLYIWSACWYGKQDTLGGYYTIAVHRIELTAATIELIASFGW
jgi:hypothetical protein